MKFFGEAYYERLVRLGLNLFIGILLTISVIYNYLATSGLGHGVDYFSVFAGPREIQIMFWPLVLLFVSLSDIKVFAVGAIGLLVWSMVTVVVATGDLFYPSLTASQETMADIAQVFRRVGVQAVGAVFLYCVGLGIAVFQLWQLNRRRTSHNDRTLHAQP